MKFFKNVKVVIGIGLIVAGMSMILAWFFHVPAREISRSEFEELLNTKALSDPVVTPSSYGGIFHVQGRHKLVKKSEKVYLTTHLDEAQIKDLFAQRGLKVRLPGAITGVQ